MAAISSRIRRKVNCYSFLLFHALIGGLPVFSYAATLPVGPGEKHAKIATAVERASPFDTVLVQAGIYYERAILVNKPVSILAKGQVVVDGGLQEANIFTIISDSVTVEGFTLTNNGVSYLKEYAAIKVKNAEAITIRGNTIENCFFGIYLEYARKCVVEFNTVIGNATDEASAGNAIHAWKATNIRISDNVLRTHRDGIYFEFVDGSIIHNNISTDNLRYGLHFMFSNDDAYLENEFSRNGAGVAVMFSKRISMQDNLFAENWGGASYGLLLKEISDGTIARNSFTENTIGILAEGASRLTITQNQFTSNGTAFDIKGNCLDNQITQNNFLANSFDVVTNSQHNNNLFEDNYWSAYAGYDLDRDGIGDIPYRPVNLFAKITDKIPAAAILLHSLIVDLLELGERIFPQLIPAELIDDHPRMKPFEYD